MQVKLFEIRDRGTMIPAYAMRPLPDNAAQRFLLRHGGYSCRTDDPIVIVGFLNAPNRAAYDQYDWNDRTMQTAHGYIEKHFYDLADGAVVDVEYILGETAQPKQSEAQND